MSSLDEWSADKRQFRIVLIPSKAHVAGDDTAGWLDTPATLDQYCWKLVERFRSGGNGPWQERVMDSKGPYASPQAAEDAINERKLEDPSLSHIPIVGPDGALN